MSDKDFENQWETADKLSRQWQAPFGMDSVKKAKESVMARIGHAETDDSPRRVPGTAWMRVAAFFVLALMLSIFAYFYSQLRLTANASESIAHVFPDGSRVDLGTSATLEYNRLLWLMQRSVDLEGDATFMVQTGNTFRVRSGRVTVEVLGTEFNISRLDEAVLVRCASGKVRLKADDRHIELKGGEMGFVAYRGDSLLSLSAPLNMGSKANVEQVIAFDEIPLHSLLDILAKIHQVDLRYELGKDEFFSGSLNLYDLELALRVLCTTFSAECEREGETIRFMP